MWQTILETLSQDAGIMLGAILGTLGIICGTAVAMTAIIGDEWRKVRQTEDNNALKQSMLDRGMTADEIAKVVSATPDRRAFFAINAGKHRVKCGA